MNKTMAKSSNKKKKVKAECTEVRRTQNNDQVRFNLKPKKGEEGNGGNVNLTVNQQGDKSIVDKFKPNEVYEITFKET